MKIFYKMYRYAPESFTARVDSMPLRLTPEQASTYGYWLAQGKHKDIKDEIKRLVRKEYKRPQLCTYGFMQTGSATTYHFSRQLRARCDSLPERLAAYKQIKRHFEAEGCRVMVGTTAELGAAYKPERIKTEYVTVDLTRPLKIYLIYADRLLAA